MSAPAVPYVVIGDPRYIERLQRNKDIVTRLCAVLHEYLSAPIDAALEQASQKPPRMPRPTMEDLNAAQQELESYETQIAALERTCENMPPEIGENFLNSQRPSIERYLKPVRDRISRIQAALEEPEDSPWDGSHHISTLCATCARPYEGFEPSIPALKVALKAAGWHRDADGDHICPPCAANLAAQPETSKATDSTSQPKGESN